MCSILGGFNIPPKIKENLFTEAEVRGIDATGLAYYKNGELIIRKTNARAGDFVKSEGFQEFLSDNPDFFIGHTRLKTQGDPTNNFNNHPLYDQDKTIALAHNGVISNDSELFEIFGLSREAEVDSEILIRLYEHFRRDFEPVKSISKVYSAIEDRASLCLLDKKTPDRAYVATNGQGFCVAYVPKYDAIIFASTEDIISSALSTHKIVKNFFKIANAPTNYYPINYGWGSDIVLEITKDEIKQYDLIQYSKITQKVEKGLARLAKTEAKALLDKEVDEDLLNIKYDYDNGVYDSDYDQPRYIQKPLSKHQTRSNKIS